MKYNLAKTPIYSYLKALVEGFDLSDKVAVISFLVPMIRFALPSSCYYKDVHQLEDLKYHRFCS